MLKKKWKGCNLALQGLSQFSEVVLLISCDLFNNVPFPTDIVACVTVLWEIGMTLSSRVQSPSCPHGIALQICNASGPAICSSEEHLTLSDFSSIPLAAKESLEVLVLSLVPFQGERFSWLHICQRFDLLLMPCTKGTTHRSAGNRLFFFHFLDWLPDMYQINRRFITLSYGGSQCLLTLLHCCDAIL